MRHNENGRDGVFNVQDSSRVGTIMEFSITYVKGHGEYQNDGGDGVAIVSFDDYSIAFYITCDPRFESPSMRFADLAFSYLPFCSSPTSPPRLTREGRSCVIFAISAITALRVSIAFWNSLSWPPCPVDSAQAFARTVSRWFYRRCGRRRPRRRSHCS